ncbi:hypothetical protein BEWA_003790 [Theileria equi strain WA]|uniref:Uncharacterized protein n=1 Tax=Theileria equi strain WA TaxID=1537102 RepID=L0B162_THEEQ|nr:hypothetical protein BEWA_003790 [Theileria equi strain WA]AFZ80971.1 hypothetical protein BEWA_003790 [Theileria equi strain WA]|eukprot:XP_004830637.1 hypothetical protein BEWA_003790 [Theileria equi strain WA]
MAVPQVIIQLKEKPGNEKTYDGYPPSRGRTIIRVTKSNYPPGSDFLKYTHVDSVSNGGRFTLLAVLDGRKPISVIREYGKEVTSVSAYYWQREKGGPKKALLVEVVYSGSGGTKYYVRGTGRNQWTLLPVFSGPYTSNKLTNSNLDQLLDDLTCEHHNAVTLNLTFQNSKTHKNGSYCCYKHNHTRVSVEQKTVSCSIHSGSAPFFKHEVNYAGKWKVAAIKYYNSGPNTHRIRINIDGLGLPTKQSVKVTVYVFYSNSSRDPVLIYVDSSGDKIKGWYQKGTTNGWIKVSGISENITPDKLTKPIDCTSEGDFKKLAEELKRLGCEGLQECTQETTEKQEARLEQLRAEKDIELRSEGVRDTEGLRSEEGKEEEKEKPSPQIQEAGPSASNKAPGVGEPKAAAIRGDAPVEALKDLAKEGLGLSGWDSYTILGAFTGVLMASVITTFASWKLYKAYQNYSDPWVRQI